MNKSKDKKWLLWVLLIFLPPIGIVYMWVTKKDFTQKTKIILSVVFSLWFIIALASGNDNNTTNQQSVANKVSTKEQNTSSINNKTTSATKETQSTIAKTENTTETQIQETTSTEESIIEPEPTINEENNENDSNNNAEANENNNEETEPYITATTSANVFTYVLNTSTKKFHVPSCSDVKKIKNTNYSEYTGTYDEVTSMGYVACKRCHPR